MKLVKLTDETDTFVVVTDETIQLGDYYINTDSNNRYAYKKIFRAMPIQLQGELDYFKKWMRKIIGSTKPLKAKGFERYHPTNLTVEEISLLLKNKKLNKMENKLIAKGTTTDLDSYTFSIKTDESIIVITEDGFKYKGELIEDKGEIYQLFKNYLTSSQTEISDEEITRLANEHILYNDSKRQWVIEGMKLYREHLKQKQYGKQNDSYRKSINIKW